MSPASVSGSPWPTTHRSPVSTPWSPTGSVAKTLVGIVTSGPRRFSSAIDSRSFSLVAGGLATQSLCAYSGSPSSATATDIGWPATRASIRRSHHGAAADAGACVSTTMATPTQAMNDDRVARIGRFSVRARGPRATRPGFSGVAAASQGLGLVLHRSTFGEQGRELIARQRLREEEALTHVAVQFEQSLQLVCSLDALRDRLEVQDGCQLDHGFR